MITLAALDIAGTTVDEGGAVYRVLADAVRAAGADPTAQQIEAWMGSAKREALAALLELSGAPADDATVDTAFADFRARLAAAYRDTPPTPFPGVPEAIGALREHGIKVALTTGFDRGVTTALLATIGWGNDFLDAVVCVDDVAAGRPAPYMIFHAMEATGVVDVSTVLVAGDTVRDIGAGRNAGAGRVIGVRTGHLNDATLMAANPSEIVDSVADLPALVLPAAVG